MDDGRTTPPDGEGPLNHEEYLRGLRREFLARLGLPENTRPERVKRLLEIREAMARLKGGDAG